MFWLDHHIPELDPTETFKSHMNMYEIAMVVGLVPHLLQSSAYSGGSFTQGCPECGRKVELPDVEFRRNAEILHEDKFLGQMTRRGPSLKRREELEIPSHWPRLLTSR